MVRFSPFHTIRLLRDGVECGLTNQVSDHK